jgi:hypothetical protein
MQTMSSNPQLQTLNGFIAKVHKYPVTVSELLQIARDMKAPKFIIDFYERFAPWLTFFDRDELASRSEQVDILREEAPAMPKEEENSPEDY